MKINKELNKSVEMKSQIRYKMRQNNAIYNHIRGRKGQTLRSPFSNLSQDSQRASYDEAQYNSFIGSDKNFRKLDFRIKPKTPNVHTKRSTNYGFQGANIKINESLGEDQQSLFSKRTHPVNSPITGHVPPKTAGHTTRSTLPLSRNNIQTFDSRKSQNLQSILNANDSILTYNKRDQNVS